jgi:hypothetical protein
MGDINKEIDKLPFLEEVLKVAELEASNKNLLVFVFTKDDLDNYFTVKYEDIVVITIAKDLDSAEWNLQNYRHSYLAKIHREEIDLTEEENKV